MGWWWGSFGSTDNNSVADSIANVSIQDLTLLALAFLPKSFPREGSDNENRGFNQFRLMFQLLHGELGFSPAFCYNLLIEQKPLIETNPYLRDPEKFRKALITSVASSTAIETGAPVATIARMLEEGEKTEPLTTTQGSAR